MSSSIQRDAIIELITSRFRVDDRVYALWLEGSDATNRLDEYSDLDFVLDVEDGSEVEVLAHLEQALLSVGPLDINYGPMKPRPDLWYKVYHLEATPATLLLDVTVQSHSRSFVFTEENEHELPKVLFDKAGVIQYKKADFVAVQNDHRKRLSDLEGVLAQQIRAVKYAKRNHFLEAHAYYHKFILHPLIELLRMRYSPLITDYYLVHISDHLPTDVVHQLEELHRLNESADVLRHVETANALFQATKVELLRIWETNEN